MLGLHLRRNGWLNSLSSFNDRIIGLGGLNNRCIAPRLELVLRVERMVTVTVPGRAKTATLLSAKLGLEAF